MRRSTLPHRIRRYTLAALTLLLTPPGLADGPSNREQRTAAPQATPEHGVVLRVTREHFDQMTRDEFRETVPIERRVLSAWVSGTPVIEGRVWI
ncbi:MAG TPA: hypothetical protein ENJ50_06935, partial [Planctomycetaceae bacterium]|nr:hypothetical protein [Planctomycetaceae bacterium]